MKVVKNGKSCEMKYAILKSKHGFFLLFEDDLCDLNDGEDDSRLCDVTYWIDINPDGVEGFVHEIENAIWMVLYRITKLDVFPNNGREIRRLIKDELHLLPYNSEATWKIKRRHAPYWYMTTGQKPDPSCKSQEFYDDQVRRLEKILIEEYLINNIFAD